MKPKIAILGDGGWGTTLAIHLDRKGYSVSLWGAFPDYVAYLNKKRVNTKFLSGIKIPKGIFITSDLEEVITPAEILVVAIPSQFLRKTIGLLKNMDLSEKIIVSVTKGIENPTFLRMSEVIHQVLGHNRHVAVLSGPTIAQEVAHGIPTTAVIASHDDNLNSYLQDIFMTERLRIYTNNDVIGVELGGSLKNIIAISCGISDGLGFGTNAKAAILTRGLVEITRLGITLGARKETFSGLTGLGDLATTCISNYSRNRFVGEQIGKGKSMKEIISHMQMVAEGVATTKAAYGLSKKCKVEMPITREVYNVIYKNKDPLQAVKDLMTRAKKKEE
ncbi:MAG: NAD(P)-dependent glycerol-3-phosphate dehydrogenase [Candidatus Omnitrophica bacterium]|nr:NAD(P)-dependent glycerol-3-phosphate dehydrogenase [Candidatus Omnitrophota bacterium]MDD5610425.1 NAD(P)-dependent glycerol-3-phosphate dehydrogenase [Candidatus Omnitrophota bacterium]